MSAGETQPEAAVRRTRLSEDPELVAALHHRIPGPVVRLEMNLRQRGDFVEQARTHAMDHLLDAARFEMAEHVVDNATDVSRGAAGKGRVRRRVAPFDIEP